MKSEIVWHPPSEKPELGVNVLIVYRKECDFVVGHYWEDHGYFVDSREYMEIMDVQLWAYLPKVSELK